MSALKLTAPTRRKRVRIERDAPFPVPIATITGEPAAIDNWNYYTGELVGTSVLVWHTGDMEFLYKKGYFGKSNLSRHQPAYNKGFWTVRKKRRHQEHESVDTLRVFSRRKYLAHLAWQRQEDGNRVEENYFPESDYDIFSGTRIALSKFAHKADESLPKPAEPEQEDQTTPPKDDRLHPGQSCDVDHPKSTADQSECALQTGYDWSKVEGNWPSVDEEEDVDPWAKDDMKSSNDFWSTSEHLPGEEQSSAPGEPVTQSQKQNTLPQVSQTCQTERETPDGKVSPNTTITDRQASPPGSVGVEEVHHTQCDDAENMCTKTGDEIGGKGQQEATESCAGWAGVHPLCWPEDETGALYVVDDTDDSADEDEDGGGDVEASKRLQWIPTRKQDPWPLKECLQLMPEEAFFLSYGLGCLVVLSEEKKPMGLVELWRTFCQRSRNFLPNYVAYHSLRSRGWVVKPGLKYGADYVLYQQGPPFYHASYCVKVCLKTEGGSAGCSDHQPTTWMSLMGSDRVTEQVAKEVLFCYVIRPRDLTEEETLSPKCLPRFKLQEVLAKRWVSSKGRQETDMDEWM